ncbi:unnamed protein product, partial [Polarella glacialis]
MPRAYGLRPDVVTFGATISACGEGQQWRWALALLADLVPRGLPPSLEAVAAALAGLSLGPSGAELWAWMLWLLHDMPRLTAGVEPTVALYSSAAVAFEGSRGAATALPDLLRR